MSFARVILQSGGHYPPPPSHRLFLGTIKWPSLQVREATVYNSRPAARRAYSAVVVLFFLIGNRRYRRKLIARAHSYKELEMCIRVVCVCNLRAMGWDERHSHTHTRIDELMRDNDGWK